MLCATYDNSNDKPELFNEKLFFLSLENDQRSYPGSLMNVKIEERSEIQQDSFS